jgi:hypothetical protein
MVLKTRKIQDTGKNYIRSFMTHTKQIFGSLINWQGTYYVLRKTYIKGFEGERNETTTKAWEQDYIIYIEFRLGPNRIHLAQDTSFVGIQRLWHGNDHPTLSKN